MTNKELIEKYPWLTPSNRWSGKWITNCAGSDGEEGYWPEDPSVHPEYNYEYTELDEMPQGWRAAFGEQMCAELNEEIARWPEQARDNFRITQIKEKYGSLRFYTSGETREFRQIVEKYEKLSKRTCIGCGQPARWISRGWISPWCDDCARAALEEANKIYKQSYKMEDEYIDIEEYYK